MKQATMQRLIAAYLDADGEDLPLYVSSLVEEERALLHRLNRIRRDRKEAIEKHTAVMKHIAQQLDDLQAECPHWETRFQGDPSGGSDKSDVCEICGKDVYGDRRR